MSSFKISIITVSWNCVDTIETTILSIINQTYSNIEYIVIDGGSTDGTVDIIKKYLNSISHWVSEPDDGIYEAMNKGIEIATGEWINFMNSGDTFTHNDVVSDIFVDEYTGVDVIYGNAIEKSEAGEILMKALQHHKVSLPPIFRHGACFVRSDVHKFQKFDISKKNIFEYALDYHFLFELHRKGYVFYFKDINILIYEKEGISNKPLKNKWLRALIENGGRKDIRFFYNLIRAYYDAAYRKILK